jgi:ribose 5-phosphate isomerase A
MIAKTFGMIAIMNQDDLKKQVAQAAKEEVLQRMPKGQYLGIGTGSTANWFIDLLAPHRDHFAGVVSSSLASTERLIKLGFYVVDASQLPESIQTQSHLLPMYVDGADEINPRGHMIKGGGGALTREKIIASLAKEFICICDESKQVNTLGKFPLPLEVIPLAQAAITQSLKQWGGTAKLRLISSGKQEGQPFLTDNGAWILDVHGLDIKDPVQLERDLNQIAGVICVGLFAQGHANLLLVGSQQGVQRVQFSK